MISFGKVASFLFMVRPILQWEFSIWSFIFRGFLSSCLFYALLWFLFLQWNTLYLDALLFAPFWWRSLQGGVKSDCYGRTLWHFLMALLFMRMLLAFLTPAFSLCLWGKFNLFNNWWPLLYQWQLEARVINWGWLFSFQMLDITCWSYF